MSIFLKHLLSRLFVSKVAPFVWHTNLSVALYFLTYFLFCPWVWGRQGNGISGTQRVHCLLPASPGTSQLPLRSFPHRLPLCVVSPASHLVTLMAVQDSELPQEWVGPRFSGHLLAKTGKLNSPLSWGVNEMYSSRGNNLSKSLKFPLTCSLRRRSLQRLVSSRGYFLGAYAAGSEASWELFVFAEPTFVPSLFFT